VSNYSKIAVASVVHVLCLQHCPSLYSNVTALLGTLIRYQHLSWVLGL